MVVFVLNRKKMKINVKLSLHLCSYILKFDFDLLFLRTRILCNSYYDLHCSFIIRLKLYLSRMSNINVYFHVPFRCNVYIFHDAKFNKFPDSTLTLPQRCSSRLIDARETFLLIETKKMLWSDVVLYL